MLGADAEATVALGLLWYLAFLFSTTLHEAGHAWAALRMGDPTAYHGGQVSLNPIPHVRREPFGMVLVPILVFALSGWMLGWASAPYDPAWADRHPKRSGLMALAGPAGNLLLVLASGLVIRLGLAAGWLQAPELGGATFAELLGNLVASAEGLPAALGTSLSVFFGLNLILFLFNLFPLPPMDGSGALPLVMSDRLAVAYRQALRHPGIAMAGLLVAWWVFPYVLWPVLGVALRVLYGG